MTSESKQSFHTLSKVTIGTSLKLLELNMFQYLPIVQEPASQRDLQPVSDLLGGRGGGLLQDQQHRGVCRNLGEDEVQQVGFRENSDR